MDGDAAGEEATAFFDDPARVPQPTALEKEKHVSEITNAAALIDLSEEVKRAMEMLSEAMSSLCYMHNADFRDLQELQEAGTGNSQWCQ